VFLALLRGLEVGDEAINGGFVLRIGQGKMDSIGVEIACASTANAAYASSVERIWKEKNHNTYPPEAPVMSASRPASSLFTDIAGEPARIQNQPNDLDRIPGEAMLSSARFAIANNEFRMVELQ
jgi:hypothetical protein